MRKSMRGFIEWVAVIVVLLFMSIGMPWLVTGCASAEKGFTSDSLGKASRIPSTEGRVETLLIIGDGRVSGMPLSMLNENYYPYCVGVSNFDAHKLAVWLMPMTMRNTHYDSIVIMLGAMDAFNLNDTDEVLKYATQLINNAQLMSDNVYVTSVIPLLDEAYSESTRAEISDINALIAEENRYLEKLMLYLQDVSFIDLSFMNTKNHLSPGYTTKGGYILSETGYSEVCESILRAIK